MKEKNDSEVVIITCKYHNGRNGHHDPYSYKEMIVAVGEVNKGHLSIEKYTQLFEKHNGNCIACRHAKIYFLNEENIRERWKRKNQH